MIDGYNEHWYVHSFLVCSDKPDKTLKYGRQTYQISNANGWNGNYETISVFVVGLITFILELPIIDNNIT